VRDGCKPRILKDREPATVLGAAWLDRLRGPGDVEEHAAGVEYARLGQVAQIELQRGAVIAQVQGTMSRPYAVRIDVPMLADSAWSALVQRLSHEAIHSARLLSAAASAELHEAIADVEVELVPAVTEAIGFACNCRRPKPCRHVAAAAFLVADRLETEPALLFTLRGMPFDELLDRLRHERQMHTQGVVTAHADPLIPQTQEAARPLESCLEDFWKVGRELDESPEHPGTHHGLYPGLHPGGAKHVPHALLRRLGPSPLKGKFPIAGLLASIYDEVSKQAKAMRDRAEGIGNGPRDGADGEAV
jgi:uncharacterized Zn finger protein